MLIMMFTKWCVVLLTEHERGMTTDQTQFVQTTPLVIIFILGCKHGRHRRQSLGRRSTFLTHEQHTSKTHAQHHNSHSRHTQRTHEPSAHFDFMPWPRVHSFCAPPYACALTRIRAIDITFCIATLPSHSGTFTTTDGSAMGSRAPYSQRTYAWTCVTRHVAPDMDICSPVHVHVSHSLLLLQDMIVLLHLLLLLLACPYACPCFLRCSSRC